MLVCFNKNYRYINHVHVRVIVKYFRISFNNFFISESIVLYSIFLFFLQNSYALLVKPIIIEITKVGPKLVTVVGSTGTAAVTSQQTERFGW